MPNATLARRPRAAPSVETDGFVQALDRIPNMGMLAESLGIPVSTVYSWRRRGVIQSVYWEAIEAYARSVGVRNVTYERFRRIEAAQWRDRMARRQAAEGET